MAFLTPRSLATYLLRQGLITPASVVCDDIVIEDAAQRNSNFKVIRKHGPSYLLKQGVDAERIASIEREAQIYTLLRSLPDAREIRRYLPRLYRYDPVAHVLILQLLRNARDLKTYHAEGHPFSARHAVALGEAVATIHQISIDQLNTTSHFNVDVPWVLTLHRPDVTVFRNISAANLELITTIQQTPEFGDLLDELLEQWQTVALIHSDLRWSNWLLCKSSRSVRQVKLKIVDWELASIGDPRWDVASLLSEYLSWWLLCIPTVAVESPNSISEPMLRKLATMQNSIRSFWRQYCRSMDFAFATRHDFLLLSVRFAAVRLIQTAYEELQASWRLNAVAVRLLQLSFNVLKHPEHAITRLLGFPPKAW